MIDPNDFPVGTWGLLPPVADGGVWFTPPALSMESAFNLLVVNPPFLCREGDMETEDFGDMGDGGSLLLDPPPFVSPAVTALLKSCIETGRDAFQRAVLDGLEIQLRIAGRHAILFLFEKDRRLTPGDMRLWGDLLGQPAFGWKVERTGFAGPTGFAWCAWRIENGGGQ